ncbi:type I restriction enzyme, S subunit [Pustulibacterium marinum]|uniref:Type I restriction enzyme, S subunit n=1 Tax=Pustulibacterium marinum TaxID=1224947 RepID=A0A1I7GXZ8_9FLAO|nr:restriction endonuclease subunit S [Pustulibacterium marinum]SFU53348.1 type I restriction enzyme, S subunit [Pustulibacterium marinum]
MKEGDVLSLPKGWDIKNLDDLCTIKGRIGYRGYTKQDLVEKGEGAITLSPSNIINNQFNLDKCTYISWFKYEESPEIMVFEGDILFVKTGSTYGKVALVENLDEKATINPQFVVFKDLKCDNRFLYYSLTTLNFKKKVESIIGGAATPTLSQTNLGRLQIPIPSLSEQKQIVAILDKAFAAIDQAQANIEKNIENAKELFQSKLNEIFNQKGDDWEEKTLGEVCEIIMGQSPKGTSYNSEGTGTALINGPVEFGNEPFSKTVMSKWTTQPTKLCEEGDLILCVRGSTTGRINIAGFQACIGRGVAAIRNVKSQKWINFFIRCNQQTIYDLGTGSTFPNVSSKILANLKIVQPKSITIQNELVKLMEKLDSNQSKIESHYQQKLANLEDLKKSLLQKAFTGELTKNIAL